MKTRQLVLGSLLATVLSSCAPTPHDSDRLKLAFVINSSSDFWSIARAGIRRAEEEFDVDVDFQIPGRGTAAEQRQIIESLIAKGTQGMAVSVLDPRGAVGILDEASRHMPVITQDSDCPDSQRIAYIGTDNVEAGRVAGREVVELLPNGGQVALFVGKLDVANAQERKAGLEEAVSGHGIEVVETFTDEVSRPVAQANVRNALEKYPDLGVLVGLWSYNAPAIIKVLEEKGIAGEIGVVAFDEESATLDALESGVVAATVVQQPYEFGYQSIAALARIVRGEDPNLADGGLNFVPVKVIDRDNVAEFRIELGKLLDAGLGSEPQP